MNKSQILLKKYFGYDNFRPGQNEIIEHILKGQDCLAIMPTGAGKSICYQIPALLLPGITFVISPLISLMKDQVNSLNEIGIPATFINSTLTEWDYSRNHKKHFTKYLQNRLRHPRKIQFGFFHSSSEPTRNFHDYN